MTFWTPERVLAGFALCTAAPVAVLVYDHFTHTPATPAPAVMVSATMTAQPVWPLSTGPFGDGLAPSSWRVGDEECPNGASPDRFQGQPPCPSGSPVVVWTDDAGDTLRCPVGQTPPLSVGEAREQMAQAGHYYCTGGPS
jgi:hypothetical protein